MFKGTKQELAESWRAYARRLRERARAMKCKGPKHASEIEHAITLEGCADDLMKWKDTSGQ